MLNYLILTPLFYLWSFLVHWYFNGGKVALHLLVRSLEFFDSFFAIRETASNIFVPLYQDYSIVGYIISLPTRLLLVTISSIIYLSLSVICLVLFTIWALLPITAFLGSVNPEIIISSTSYLFSL